MERHRPFLLCFVLLWALACDVHFSTPPTSLVPPPLTPLELAPAPNALLVTEPVVIALPTKQRARQVDLHRQLESRVDILWVVDDSGSMQSQRSTLWSNFENFVTQLLQLQVDFHIGVVSSNPSDQGRLRGTTPVISSKTPDAIQAFIENTTFANSRSRWEQGLRMAELALSSPNIDAQGPNHGFLRPTAALAIIVVSDEDDGSLGAPEYYVRRFRSLKGKGNEQLVTFSAIAGDLPSGCFPPGKEKLFGSLAKPAVRYSAVSKATGGVFGSICDFSFEDTLKDIGLAINSLRREFPLSVSPIEDSLAVYVNQTLVPSQAGLSWKFQKNTHSILFAFNSIPPPGASVRIEYSY